MTRFLTDSTSLSLSRIKARNTLGRGRLNSGPAACCTIVNTLHISRSIRGPSFQPTSPPFQRDLLSPSDRRAFYSANSQLTKIDRAKVHDGAGHIGFLLCVSSARGTDAGFFFFFFLHCTFRTFHYNNAQLLAVSNVVYDAPFLCSRFSNCDRFNAIVFLTRWCRAHIHADRIQRGNAKNLKTEEKPFACK